MGQDQRSAALRYYRKNSPFWLKKIKKRTRGGRSDKQQAAPETSVQSEKSLRHLERDSKHIFFVRENIFAVMFAPWQEDCGAAVESTFQPKKEKKSVSPACDTEKIKRHGR